MKRDLATAEALLEVPAPLFFNLVDRVLDLTTPRRSSFPARWSSCQRPHVWTTCRRSARPTKAACLPASRSHQGERMALVLLAGDRGGIRLGDRNQVGGGAGRRTALAHRRAGALRERREARLREGVLLDERPYASDPSYAWVQGFSGGGQYYGHTSGKTGLAPSAECPFVNSPIPR
jgi:hypothetical protein